MAAAAAAAGQARGRRRRVAKPLARLRELLAVLTWGEPRHPAQAVLRGIARWTFVFARQLGRDRAVERASSMTYVTLVALVPLRVLLFGVLGASGVLEGNQEFLGQVVLDLMPVLPRLLELLGLIDFLDLLEIL